MSGRSCSRGVKTIEGENFEKQVLDKLVLFVGRDPKIDPKDDILSIIRLFWHFGVLNDRYYRERAKELLRENPSLSAKDLKDQLGLITYKTAYCKELLNALGAARAKR
jgi:hypothetical protein